MTKPVAAKATRRTALGATAGLLSTAVGAQASKASAKRQLDFKDPQDQLYALMKMTGDLEDGKETISWMKGIVHAIFEDGKILEPMFYAGTLAFSRSYKQTDGSYKNMSNFTICYLDLETEAVLDNWYNPWLEKEVEVVNYASTLHTIVKPMSPINDHTKLRVEWMIDGNDVIRWSDGKIVKDNPITPDKWPRASVGKTYYKNQQAQLIARRDEVEDPDLTSVQALTMGQRHGPWYPWMLMGQDPGRTYRRDVSKKARTLDDVPSAIPAYAESRFPDFMTAPTEWTGAYIDPETLWARDMPPE
ncbi:MAG: DUF1838 family protein [Rhodospirillaceae bacterium]